MADLPRLSVCVIARNEASVIGRCLASVASIAQEIIVVDTGSTDDTAAIAQQAGAAVSFFAWRDDFSAARNAALAQASGDWILWLDADEALLPESAPLVPALIARSQAQAYMVLRQEVEEEDQQGYFVESSMPRLWRNDPDLRFTGRCHPHFGTLLEERAARTGQQTLDSAIRLRHDGYLQRLLPDKLRRAERLLQLELAERPGQLYYEIELARTWQRLDDERGKRLLIHVLNRILQMANLPYPPTALAAPLLEACIRGENPSSSRAHLAISCAERWFPLCPPLLAAIGETWYRVGEFARALPYLQRLVRCAETNCYDRSIPFVRSVLWGEAPMLNLAVCYHRLARLGMAERCYHRLLQRFPDHPGATHNLTLLRQQRLLYSATEPSPS